MDTTVYNDDCVNVLAELLNESVDLVVTSPPYWNQREYSTWPTYADYLADVKVWLQEIYRVLKPGRLCFWVIPDKLPFPPKENGTKQRLYMPVYADTEKYASSLGFICEFPIIWDKRGENLSERSWSKKLWGSYPYPVGIIHTQFTERICVWKKNGHHGLSQKDREDSKITVQQFNEWAWDIWSIKNSDYSKHPAPFPEEIPTRIITLWSCIGDLVVDPFMGSGTTGIACKKLNRRFIGIEKDENYCNIARERLQAL